MQGTVHTLVILPVDLFANVEVVPQPLISTKLTVCRDGTTWHRDKLLYVVKNQDLLDSKFNLQESSRTVLHDTLSQRNGFSSLVHQFCKSLVDK